MSRRKRTIVGLKRAELLGERPPFIPEPDCKGVQLTGLRYEKKVADYLKNRYGEKRVWHGPWFEFEDRHGKGWCSPDVLVFPTGLGPVVVGEVKLTVTRDAQRQLQKLYIPVVRHLWPNNPIRPVQISLNLRQGFDGTLTDLDEILSEEEPPWKFATLRWRPK